MKMVRIALVLVLLLVMASCALEPTWSINGKWVKLGDSETVEFSHDGLALLTGADAVLSVPYRFVDPKHIEVNFGSFGQAIMAVAVAKNELILTNLNGEETRYRRVVDTEPPKLR
jgi:hypothetical protein